MDLAARLEERIAVLTAAEELLPEAHRGPVSGMIEAFLMVRKELAPATEPGPTPRTDNPAPPWWLRWEAPPRRPEAVAAAPVAVPITPAAPPARPLPPDDSAAPPIPDDALSVGVQDGEAVAEMAEPDGGTHAVALPASPAPATGTTVRAAGRAAGRASALTEAREKLFRDLWPQPEISARQVMARLNALPGPPITVKARLYDFALQCGLPTRRQPEAAEEAPAAEPAPAPPADPARREMREDSLTEERRALMLRAWPDLRLSLTELLAEYNALPGRPIGNPLTFYAVAARCGLPTKRHVAAERAGARTTVAPPPAAPEAPADASVAACDATPHVTGPAPEASGQADPLARLSAEERDEAHDIIVTRGKGARALVDWFGWELPAAQEVAAALRAAAAANPPEEATTR